MNGGGSWLRFKLHTSQIEVSIATWSVSNVLGDKSGEEIYLDV